MDAIARSMRPDQRGDLGGAAMPNVSAYSNVYRDQTVFPSAEVEVMLRSHWARPTWALGGHGYRPQMRRALRHT
jgi:hypothetical protein